MSKAKQTADDKYSIENGLEDGQGIGALTGQGTFAIIRPDEQE